jgi:hypothetical protein
MLQEPLRMVIQGQTTITTRNIEGHSVFVAASEEMLGDTGEIETSAAGYDDCLKSASPLE